MVSASAAVQSESFSLPRLEVTGVGDHRVVHLNGHRIALYPREDRLTERVIVTQLVEVSGLPAKLVAEIFERHFVTVSRWRSLARDAGAQALVPERPGPKGPSKRTRKLEDKILRLRSQGLSYRSIAKRLTRKGLKISHTLVATVIQEHEQNQPMVLPGVEASQRNPPQALPEPVAAPTIGATTSRYAGATLLYAALSRLDVWGVLSGLQPSVDPSRHAGWRQVVAALIFCFALRFRSVEDLKNAEPRDLGAILGEAASPGVQTLRRKVGRLAESIDPVDLSRELFRRYLTLEPVWEGLYYVDGHFVPYYGTHRTPKGWSSKRRLAESGHTDVYVHDARGRVLFFLSQPLNDSLARAIPSLVQEIRAVHGRQPFTVVFDRGGYSSKLFRWFDQEGIGYITYLKGRKARRHYPLAKFSRGWFALDGKRTVYRLYEKRTRIRGPGLVRTVIYLGDDREQIPVLTNLQPAVRGAKVVHCLRLRWGQENSLKYLLEHYAIDQLIQYGASQEKAERVVKNPRRKELNRKIRELRSETENLEAELGRILESAADAEPEAVRDLRQRLEKLRRSMTRLENRRRNTPTKLKAAELGPQAQRFLLKEDRRLLVNSLKLAAHNAERLLALQFDRHYRQRKDVLSVFRALFHLSGTLTRRSAQRIEVTLERPSPEKVARALAALLAEINQDHPRLLGNGPALHFCLRN
ncbi:MAG: hypothetical protein GY926_13400 [bacterium]|nr:hypothetical protein [bacterium]